MVAHDAEAAAPLENKWVFEDSTMSERANRTYDMLASTAYTVLET
jgi:hypothetical protein